MCRKYFERWKPDLTSVSSRSRSIDPFDGSLCLASLNPSILRPDFDSVEGWKATFHSRAIDRLLYSCGPNLGISGRVLARLDLELIHDLLHIGDMLRKRFSFFPLGCGLHCALQDQRSVFRRTLDALIVQVFVRFDGSFEVILYRAVEIGCNRPGLTDIRRTHANFVGNRVVRGSLLGQGFCLTLQVLRRQVPGQRHHALLAILRYVDGLEIVAVQRTRDRRLLVRMRCALAACQYQGRSKNGRRAEDKRTTR